jgi:Mn-dependent DtxR family transcriptional regulator
MQILESGEMYIETIYVLTKKGAPPRAMDVGEHMGFSKPSVSRAIGILKKNGFVTVGDDGAITLTDEGIAIAEKIFERHTILTAFLEKIGVPPEVAEQDACKIEHRISDDSVAAIKRFL